MNNILKISLTVFLFVVIYLSSLWFLPKPEIVYMDDENLRKYALSHGLAPVPTSFKELLKVTDNPQNPLTKDKIELGKELYFDPILSLDESISCASCHLLDQGGDDNLPTAIGYHGLANPKHLNSPTVLNAALAKAQFWDGSAKDVEAQAKGPMTAPFEMNITPKEAVKRVKQKYQSAFDQVFDGNVSFLNIQNAIGAYERTLLTRSGYDLFLEGDNSAINASAKKGLNLFIQKGCKGCHTGMSVGGQSIQQFPLRRTLDSIFSNEPFPFKNEGGYLGKNDKKRFRVPILRNITKTAPYFHNGSVKELEEVIRIMSEYQLGDEFSKEEIDDVVEFFKSLEGELVSYDLGD